MLQRAPVTAAVNIRSYIASQANFDPSRDAEERDCWRTWLLEHTVEGRDYLFPWLCDAKFCRPMNESLLELFRFLQEGWTDFFLRTRSFEASAAAAVEADLALQRCFAKLFAKIHKVFLESEGHAGCQASVRGFLDALLSMGSPYAEALKGLVVGEFDTHRVSTQTRAALSDFIARVEKSPYHLARGK